MIWILISLIVLFIISAIIESEALGILAIFGLMLLGLVKCAMWYEEFKVEMMNDIKRSEILEYNNKEYHSKGFVEENFDTYRFIDIETDREVILPINNTKRKK